MTTQTTVSQGRKAPHFWEIRKNYQYFLAFETKMVSTVDARRPSIVPLRFNHHLLDERVAPNEDLSYYTKQVVPNAHLIFGSPGAAFIPDSALLPELLTVTVQAVGPRIGCNVPVDNLLTSALAVR